MPDAAGRNGQPDALRHVPGAELISIGQDHGEFVLTIAAARSVGRRIVASNTSPWVCRWS
jgi:hypothetical protein